MCVCVCRSINCMNLSPRKGVRVGLLRGCFNAVIIQSNGAAYVYVFGRACVRIYSKSTSIFIFSRQTHEIQSLFIFVRRCFLVLCVFNCLASQLSVVEVLCVWFWAAEQKSHSVLFGSAAATATTMAMGFSVGNSAGRFIWFLVVLPPSVLWRWCYPIINPSLRVALCICAYTYIKYIYVDAIVCYWLRERFINLQSISIDFFLCVSYCQFDMQKNEIGWIHKCTRC